jgi:hypothetical protein
MQPFPETQQTISSHAESLIQVEHLSRVITTRTRNTTILDDVTFSITAGSQWRSVPLLIRFQFACSGRYYGKGPLVDDAK